MQYLFIRRICEMIILTVIPSLIASVLIQLDSVQGAIFYPVLAIISVVCAVIFFGGNLLMMRRMTRDIKSRKIYMIVQLTTFTIYAILIALICVFTWGKSEAMFWKDARVAFFFHSRVFEVICDPIVIDPDDLTKNLISPNMSMIISTALFGLITIFSHPFFKKRYAIEQKELEKIKKEEEKFTESDIDKIAVSVKEDLEKELEESEFDEDEFDEDLLLSIREFERIDNRTRFRAPTRKQRIRWSAGRISASRSNDVKLRDIVKDAILNFGSYEFYQNLIEKQQGGEYTGKYIQNHLKNKVSLKNTNNNLK